MLASLIQYASLAVLAGVAMALIVEVVRLVGQVLRDRRADRLRIQQLVREIESIATQPFRAESAAGHTGAASGAAENRETRDATTPRNRRGTTSVTRNGTSPAAPGNEPRTPTVPAPAWQGTRTFRVVQKTMECDACASLYLVPVDGQPLPLYLPGQFLTFTLKIPGQSKSTVRCYSLSDAPCSEFYRCTIKKLAPDPARPGSQPGLVSSYVHDRLNPGDLLDVAAPRGSFFLDVFSQLPVVLIAAGIGITPLLSMLNTLIQTGMKNRIFLFFGVRHGSEHPFRKHLSKLAAQHAHLSLTTVYSQPLPQDKLGTDYHICGHLDVELIKQTVQTTAATFYLCGPNKFMQSMVSGLVAWGVPPGAIRYETFGPSSVVDGSRTAKRKATVLAGGHSHTAPITVQFAQSHKAVPWDEHAESLLDFAERQGIEIASGCRAGNCGTCATFLKSGSVDYGDHADPICEAGHCLPCICTPAESLVLDA